MTINKKQMKRTGVGSIEVYNTTVQKKPRSLVQSKLVLTAQGPRLARGDSVKEPDEWLTEEMAQQMRGAVALQPAEYLHQSESPYCAFGQDHECTQLRVCYTLKSYECLVQEFLNHRGRDPPQNVEIFLQFWAAWHEMSVKWRFLCPECYTRLYTTPREKRRVALLTEVKTLKPSLVMVVDKDELAHQWLDLKNWGEKNDKGNYKRQLDGQWLTLFYRKQQWHWAYDNKFSPKGYDRIQDALQATYQAHRELIEK